MEQFCLKGRKWKAVAEPYFEGLILNLWAGMQRAFWSKGKVWTTSPQCVYQGAMYCVWKRELLFLKNGAICIGWNCVRTGEVKHWLMYIGALQDKNSHASGLTNFIPFLYFKNYTLKSWFILFPFIVIVWKWNEIISVWNTRLFLGWIFFPKIQ